MIRESKSYIKKLILSLLVVIGSLNSLFSQTKINGTINEYGHVTGIGADFVMVDDPLQFAQFAIGDTVLLIQMKGARVFAQEITISGSLDGYSGTPGKHEFLLVSDVGVGNKITFKNKIINSFSVDGSVQIIKVPSFKNSAVVDDSDLTCAPWDSITKTGGVLTMIVGKTLFLNKNIDVSGKGFKGGAISEGIGLCILSEDVATRDKYVYNSTYTNSGFKGESPATRGTIGFSPPAPPYLQIYPDYSKGKAPSFTGGGAGNGRFSGGGGGANYGDGGKGDIETCASPPGANGGFKIKLPELEGGIFMGGGGGSSTYFNDGSIPSPGGRGGGIIIIICGEINGNGKSILSNGGTAVKAFSNAGSGGGGGGGSVALYLENFASSSLTISANGGNGGDNAGLFGTGGGGGGGLIKISNITIPGLINQTVLKGLRGLRLGSRQSTDGADGAKFTDFVAVLNGFLFNIIRSSVTGDQTDSICSNMMPPKITGSKPVGGSAPYTYLWEKSYDEVTWETLTNDADPVNYTPTVIETATVYFRRTITDSSLPDALIDVSKSVKIIVQPFIKNNIVGNSDTICFAQNPVAFISKLALADGNGIYSFKWKVSTDNILYGLPGNTYNTEGYTPPPALKINSWYKRIVTSGRCVDSTAIVKITVRDTIRNNRILTPAQDICFGSTFVDLSGTTTTTSLLLGGGDNLYRFKWISSINGAAWGIAPGTSNTPDYNPVELNPSPNVYNFKRIVLSGISNACADTTKTILLRDYPVITNNTITLNQVICSGSAPQKLIGSSPLNGNGAYTYTWQDSSELHTWGTAISGATSSDYQPPVLTDSISYRRIVNSSACSDISKSVKIFVHKPILNNSISLLAGGLTDTTICNGAIPHLLKGTVPTGGTNIPGDFVYEWYVSTDNTVFSPATGSNNGFSYQPSSLVAATYYYKRQVTSGSCIIPYTLSTTITITVLPTITNNVISGKASVCYNTVPSLLSGSGPVGGSGTYSYLWEQSTDGTSWLPASLIYNVANYQPPALVIPMKYRRTVNSGNFDCCTSISSVFSITINPLPTGEITNTADSTICGGSQIELKIHLTGIVSDWKVTYQENVTPSSVNGSTAPNLTLLVTPLTTPASTSTLFNYSLLKVEDSNGCMATSMSGTKKVVVYTIPKSDAGPAADTVCGPTITLKAAPSVGTGMWYFPSAVVASTPNSATVTVTIDSTFTGNSISHKFIWKELNWQCSGKDSITVKFDKRVTPVNAGRDTTLNSFDGIFHTKAAAVLVGSGVWSLVEGSGTFDNYLNNSTVIKDLSSGMNKFLWKVTNGKCVGTDILAVNLVDIFVPEGFSPNNDGFNNTFIITGLDLPNQIAELKIVNGAGVEVFSTSNINGQVWTDWDGRNTKGTDMPEGTYYYLLKLKSAGTDGNGQVYPRSGFIILKRY